MYTNDITLELSDLLLEHHGGCLGLPGSDAAHASIDRLQQPNSRPSGLTSCLDLFTYLDLPLVALTLQVPRALLVPRTSRRMLLWTVRRLMVRWRPSPSPTQHHLSLCWHTATQGTASMTVSGATVEQPSPRVPTK
jgi:hypothetical protein